MDRDDAAGLDLFREFTGLVGALADARVDYAVVGALALAIHGVPRATVDIDLLVPPEAVTAAVEVGRSRGYLAEAVPLTFPDGMVIHRLNRFHGKEHLTLDLIVVNENLRHAWASRGRVESEEGPIWVVSRQALLRMKAAAGRPQDLADVERLREQDR